MSIVFDQVDGVVQKEGDPAAAGAGAADAAAPAPQRPSEQLEEAHRRLAWLTRRITAD